MPKRSRTGKPDVNQMAANLIDAISGEPRPCVNGLDYSIDL
jgi:hypothetical protein